MRQPERGKDRGPTRSSSHPELRPRFLQGLGGRVQRSPLVCELSLPPLPALQKQGGPHHVEERKHHAADVPACLKQEEELLLYSNTCVLHHASCSSHLIRLGQHPQHKADHSRIQHGSGVKSQPGKIHGHLHPKVVTDIICKSNETGSSFVSRRETADLWGSLVCSPKGCFSHTA